MFIGDPHGQDASAVARTDPCVQNPFPLVSSWQIFQSYTGELSLPPGSEMRDPRVPQDSECRGDPSRNVETSFYGRWAPRPARRNFLHTGVLPADPASLVHESPHGRGKSQHPGLRSTGNSLHERSSWFPRRMRQRSYEDLPHSSLKSIRRILLGQGAFQGH